MSLKVGINGFGRIGRMVLRSIIESNRKDLEVIAINNKSNSEISSFLLKHDTIHGKLKAKISHSEKQIEINGKKISLIRESEISKIDWKKFNVNVVLECSGKFNTKEKSSEHINSGAKKVLVSAPCKGAINVVAKKQIGLIKLWEANNPDWSKTDKGAEQYIQMVRSITDAGSQTSSENNIIRTIAKEVLIEK